MKRYLKCGLVGGTLGAVVAIPLFPVWMAWVDKFQTLITGVAAVAAAYLAIRQSQITDANSDRRHDQLMELSLRPIRLKIDRTVRPMAERIAGALEDIERWQRRLSAANGASFLKDNVEEFHRLSVHWVIVVNDHQLQIGEDFFSGYMLDALRVSKEATSSIVEEFDQIRHMIKAGAGASELTKRTGRLQSAMATLAEHLGYFWVQLGQLERDYLAHIR
ncbi:hypothetical protein EFR00_25035 [Rhizobium sophoriradicis]|uniref:hypothetical protein n=1 Tax=Rhizobium TaxID=379 RepID=UPI0001904DE5|nr:MULTISPECIES: hypothetical protein [Rhizobium]RSB91792.1 hypothetical protein EFR00_25035 [Rhizobium sophoriradicis]